MDLRKIKKKKKKAINRKMKVPIKLSRIGKTGMYHLKAKNQYWLTMTFIRIQEFYESPLNSIRGNKFTLEEYMDYYSERFGNFTYTEDWSGFNIPDQTFVDFFNLFSLADLSNKEKKLYELVQPMMRNYLVEGKPFCIIGTYTKDDLDHEIAHGLYHLNESYKYEMDECVKEWKYRVQFGKMLKKIGYSAKTMKDEIQAYLSTSTRSYLKGFGYKDDWDIPPKFKNIFRKYKKKGIK